MNDLEAKRSFMVSINHKHGHNTKQQGVSGRYGSCPFYSVRMNGDGLPLSPGTPAPELQPALDADTGAVFRLGKQAGPGHGAVVAVGPGEGSQCGTLWKGRVIFILNGTYFTHFQCPMGYLHPDTHPGSLCVRWQASATGCGVLAQLFNSSWRQQAVFWMSFYTPSGSVRIFKSKAKFLLPIVLLFSLSGCLMAPLLFLLASLP